MKKIASTLLTGFILLSVFPNTGSAQNIVAGISNDEFTGTTSETINKEYVKTGEVAMRALRNFEKSFKPAENVNWYKVKGGFMVYFRLNGDKKVCGYDLKGNWMYNFVSYGEDKLPRPIWYLVKSVYYDYSIVWINQIQTINKTIYVVHLDGKDTYKNIRVCNDEMDVLEEIRKI